MCSKLEIMIYPAAKKFPATSDDEIKRAGKEKERENIVRVRVS